MQRHRVTPAVFALFALTACSPSAPPADVSATSAVEVEPTDRFAKALVEPELQANAPSEQVVPELGTARRAAIGASGALSSVFGDEAEFSEFSNRFSGVEGELSVLGRGASGLRSTAIGRGGGGEGLGRVQGVGGIDRGTITGYGHGSGSAGSGRTSSTPLDDANRENFEHYGFNGWTLTYEDALATFSVDVDTASYSIARRDLNAARLPNPASVRVEEFVNVFNYGYPGPTDDVPFAVHLEAAPSRFGEGAQLLRVGIQGVETHRADRAPANLVFLVDSSGSMQAPNKLPLVKYALRALLAGLRPDDTLSIVTYAGSATTVLPPTRVRDHLAIVHAIESITARGGTNGADGIRTAYELAEQSYVMGGTNRVIWCSDGDLNVGMTGDQLLEYIEARGRRGVALTTLGFGTGNLNDRDLERFANRGDGNYHYIDDRNEALRVLATDMAGTIEVIARDVKIQVDVNPDVVSAYRLIGYENRNIADADFRDDTVDAGEIGSGHSATALLELVYNVGAEPAADAVVATVRVRYELPAEEGEGREIASTLRARDVHRSFDVASPSFRLSAAVAEFAEVLRMSEFVSANDLDAVEAIITSARGAGDLQLEELAALVSAANVLM